MEKVVIEGDEIKKIASVLKDKKVELDNDVEKLDMILDGINKAWQGADATQYTKNMRDNYNVLLKGFNEVLDSYITFLDGVIDVYDKFDRNHNKEVNI